MDNAMTKTHKGLFLGVVPVYLDMTDESCPGVQPRHWAFTPLLHLCEMIFGMCVFLRSRVDADYVPAYPVTVTHTISQFTKFRAIVRLGRFEYTAILEYQNNAPGLFEGRIDFTVDFNCNMGAGVYLKRSLMQGYRDFDAQIEPTDGGLPTFDNEMLCGKFYASDVEFVDKGCTSGAMRLQSVGEVTAEPVRSRQ